MKAVNVVNKKNGMKGVALLKEDGGATIQYKGGSRSEVAASVMKRWIKIEGDFTGNLNDYFPQVDAEADVAPAAEALEPVTLDEVAQAEEPVAEVEPEPVAVAEPEPEVAQDAPQAAEEPAEVAEPVAEAEVAPTGATKADKPKKTREPKVESAEFVAPEHQVQKDKVENADDIAINIVKVDVGTANSKKACEKTLITFDLMNGKYTLFVKDYNKVIYSVDLHAGEKNTDFQAGEKIHHSPQSSIHDTMEQMLKLEMLDVEMAHDLKKRFAKLRKLAKKGYEIGMYQ